MCVRLWAWEFAIICALVLWVVRKRYTMILCFEGCMLHLNDDMGHECSLIWVYWNVHMNMLMVWVKNMVSCVLDENDNFNWWLWDCVHYVIYMKLYVYTLWMAAIWELLNNWVCWPYRVVDKPCISLSDTLGPAMLANQDFMITKVWQWTKRHLRPHHANG